MAAGTVFVSGGLGMAVLGAIVAVAAPVTLLQGEVPEPYLIGVPLTVLLLLGAGLLAVKMLRSPAVRTTILDAGEKLLARMRARVSLHAARAFLDDAAQTLPPLRRLWLPARWSALNWLAEAAVLLVLVGALDQWVHPAVVLVGYGAAQLLNALPITPGGLGLVEAGLAATYVAFGLSSGAFSQPCWSSG